MQKSVTYFLLVIFFVLFSWSIFVRFYQFSRVPTGLYWDEAAILLDAKSVSETGKDIHGRPWFQVIYPSYGDYKQPIYILATALVVKVIGVSDAAVRIPNAAAGLGTILVAVGIIRSLLSFETEQNTDSKEKKTLRNLAGICTAVVLLCAPWSILFARTGFEAYFAQFLLGVSVLALLHAKKFPVLFFIAPLFGLAATYTYFSVRFVWIVLFCAVCLLQINWSSTFSKTFFQKNVRFFALFGLTGIIFLIGLLPMLKSPLYAESNRFRLSTDSVLQNEKDVIQSNIYRELAGNNRVDRVIFSRWILTGKKLLSNYSDNMSLNFLFFTGDPNLRHGTTVDGLFFSIFLIPFVVGLLYLLSNRPKVLFFFFIWWLISLLPASIPNTTPHALRSLNALIPLSCVIGVGLAVLLDRVFALKSHTLRFLLLGLTTFVLLFEMTSFTLNYFGNYKTLSAPSWQSGFKATAQKIFAERESNEAVYVLSFDDRFYLWLLLYGPYSSTQIQNFPRKNFQIRDFGNIYTEHIPDAKESQAIVVGPLDQVQKFASSEKYLYSESKKSEQTDSTLPVVMNLKKTQGTK